MRERELTQAGLAEALGVTQGAVSGWCGGAIPKGDQLFALARFFGVTMEAMLMNRRSFESMSVCEDPVPYQVPDPRAKEAKAIAAELERLAARMRSSFDPECHGRRASEMPKPPVGPIKYPKKSKR